MTTLDDLEARFLKYEFYAALRLIECAYPTAPRLGKSARAADDPVRLGQVPTLAFEPSVFVEARRRADGKLWLGEVFFGVFGPNGPLPLHLTEFAHDRRHNFRDSTLAGFADVFHHRMLSLFYRGWADAQPTVHRDRPASDRFRLYVGSLAGFGQKSLQDRDSMPDPAKLYHVGRLSAHTRNAEGLRTILEDYFAESVRIDEFRSEWLTLEERDRWYLGVSPHANALGVGSIIGRRVWGRQSRFRVVLGPLNFAAFKHFLPGSDALKALVATVRNYVGFELQWDLQLIVKREEVPGIRLGDGARLGYSSWLAAGRRARDADDVILEERAQAST